MSEEKLVARVSCAIDENDMIVYDGDMMSWKLFTKSMLKAGWRLHIEDGRMIADKEFEMSEYEKFIEGES